MVSETVNSTMVLRPATDLDGPAVKKLVYGVLAEYKLKPEPEGIDADLDALSASYPDRGGIFEVLETANGQIVGSYGLYAMDGKCCELRKMYLLPEARGQGLGKALLERALTKACKLGFVVMQLETASCLVEAIGLYRSFGFESLQGKHEVERCDLAFSYNLAQWDNEVNFSDRYPRIETRES